MKKLLLTALLAALTPAAAIWIKTSSAPACSKVGHPS